MIIVWSKQTITKAVAKQKAKLHGQFNSEGRIKSYLDDQGTTGLARERFLLLIDSLIRFKEVSKSNITSNISLITSRTESKVFVSSQHRFLT